MSNKKKTSSKVAAKASGILKDKNASKIQKTLAGSALSQSKTKKQTSSKIESVASSVLSSSKYSSKTKEIAGSVLSQSVKGNK